MVIVPINTDEDGNARCIKTTYLKAGLTNFMRAEWGGQKDGFSATAIAEYSEPP